VAHISTKFYLLKIPAFGLAPKNENKKPLPAKSQQGKK